MPRAGSKDPLCAVLRWWSVRPKTDWWNRPKAECLNCLPAQPVAEAKPAAASRCRCRGPVPATVAAPGPSCQWRMPSSMPPPGTSCARPPAHGLARLGMATSYPCLPRVFPGFRPVIPSLLGHAGLVEVWQSAPRPKPELTYRWRRSMTRCSPAARSKGCSLAPLAPSKRMM